MTLEQQLKSLRNKGNPAEEWLNQNRRVLTNNINYILAFRETRKELDALTKVRIDFLYTWKFTVANMRKVMALLVIAVLSSSGLLTAKASLAAVPGDALYSVKRNIIEKVELVLAPTPEDEAAVYLKHVASRLDEIRILNERNNLTPEDKTKLIDHTVLSLNRDLTAARQSLKIAVKENSQSKTVVAIAKGISQSAKDIKKMATATITDDNKNLSQSVSEAVDNADQANTDSLDVLLQQQNQHEVNNEELKQLVTQLIETVSKRVEVVYQAAVVSGREETYYKIRSGLYALLNDNKPLPFDQLTVNNVRSQMDQAKKQLAEAKKVLQLNNFRLAADWANQAKDNTESVAGLLNKVSALISVPLLPEDIRPTATTSSVETIDDNNDDEAQDDNGQVIIINDDIGQLGQVTGTVSVGSNSKTFNTKK